MDTIKDFYKGQKVEIKDQDTGKLIKGKVTKVDNHMELVYIQWDDLMDPVKHPRSEWPLIIAVTRRRKTGEAKKHYLVILLIMFLTCSCAPSHKMVMPNGCKPPKKAKHEMVNPEPTIKRKK